MTGQEIEEIYEAMARALDGVGPDKSDLFLAKLALLLAEQAPDNDSVLRCIEAAKVAD